MKGNFSPARLRSRTGWEDNIKMDLREIGCWKWRWMDIHSHSVFWNWSFLKELLIVQKFYAWQNTYLLKSY